LGNGGAGRGGIATDAQASLQMTAPGATPSFAGPVGVRRVHAASILSAANQ
jgi:hypothetical protein